MGGLKPLSSPDRRLFRVRIQDDIKDAIHFACARFIKADYFLSCDNRLVSQAKKLGSNMAISNSVDYIRREDL